MHQQPCVRLHNEQFEVVSACEWLKAIYCDEPTLAETQRQAEPRLYHPNSNRDSIKVEKSFWWTILKLRNSSSDRKLIVNLSHGTVSSWVFDLTTHKLVWSDLLAQTSTWWFAGHLKIYHCVLPISLHFSQTSILYGLYQRCISEWVSCEISTACGSC